MKPLVINDRVVALREEMKAAVRIEMREVHGRLMEVKVYPDSRGSGYLVVDEGRWRSLSPTRRKKRGMKAKR